MASRLLTSQQALLLVVDVQERLLAAMDHPERLAHKVTSLVRACGRLDVPVVVFEQYPKGLGHTAGAILEALPPGVRVLEKTAFGCLGDAGIRDALAASGRRQVVVCGMETHVCVNQTVHQLLASGYQVHVAQDAVASRHKRDYKTALVRMEQSGAIPSSVEMVLFELLGDARHEAFKEIQALVK